MKVAVACLLVCLCIAVNVHAADVDANEQSDVGRSRHKRGFIEDIFSGLKNKFTETVDKVLTLKGEVFEKVVKGVKKIGLGAAKKIYGFFQKFSKEHHDLDAETAGRMDRLMSAFRDDIAEREAAAAGSSAPKKTILSLMVAFFLSMSVVYFLH